MSLTPDQGLRFVNKEFVLEGYLSSPPYSALITIASEVVSMIALLSRFFETIQGRFLLKCIYLLFFLFLDD